MTKISDVASDLYNTHKKFNNTVKSHKWDRMQDSYAALNQTMVTWGKKIRLTRKMPKKAEWDNAAVYAQDFQILLSRIRKL